jgi:hypothetical protein
MDVGQAQIDQTVDAVNSMGHDAMEVAYDVDQLFSNWRCNNCSLEGEAQLDEAGGVDLSGDLFENLAPCVAPVAPGDPSAVPADPAAPAPTQAPEGGDVSQPPPDEKKTSRRWFPLGKKKAKIEELTSRVLKTNPGMTREAAREVAKKTVEQYPSLVR